MLPAFEAARADFRQDPTPDRLAEAAAAVRAALQRHDPDRRDEAEGARHRLRPQAGGRGRRDRLRAAAGTEAFDANCAGGDKLDRADTPTDALFGFARKCLSDSGLPSKQTDELRTKITFIELNRDDKAHRFVVTWNAFQDGNRLAYLALAIAIGIDC